MMGAPTKKSPKNYSKLDDSQLTWPHEIAQRICVLLILGYLLIFYRVRFRGREHQPKKHQSYIVACNHASSLDPPLVSLALYYQPISFLAKKELFETFWMRTYNYLMASIAVNREKMEISTVKSALKVLANGKWALGLFPEGTRSKDGNVGEAKRGVAFFSHSAKVPVLPLAIAYTTPPKGRKRVDVQIGPMIPYDPNRTMEETAQLIQETLAKLVEQTRTEAQERP